jgi:16S rRNA (cytosine967-C5)-methyltransferase
MIPEMARQGGGFPIQLLACSGGAGIAEGELFDGVMVDAPCSNTGVLGARPAARWRFGPANLRALVSLQRDLLVLASKRVAQGGRLLWSVCSIEPEEGLQQVRGFLQDHPEFELDDSFLALPSSEGPVDGGFAARLIKTGG